MPDQVSFRVTNVGTVVVQYGEDEPKKHKCELPDEQHPTGTIVQCEECGAYWRCFGQRPVAYMKFPHHNGYDQATTESKWEQLGLFGTWYYVWRKR